MPELLTALLKLLQGSALGDAARSIEYLYPFLEASHILAITLLVGPAFIFDLRLLGVGHRTVSVTTAARNLLPISHVGFFVALLTGVAMLSAQAMVVAGTGAAPWKFGLLILACVNVLIFHCGIYRRVSEWRNAAATPGRRPPFSSRITDRVDRRDLCRPPPGLHVMLGGTSPAPQGINRRMAMAASGRKQPCRANSAGCNQ